MIRIVLLLVITVFGLHAQELPYALPEDHPLFAPLEEICHESRVFRDQESFQEAGFHPLCNKRGFLVGYLPDYPDWVVKGVADGSSMRKRSVRSFINRAETAARMHAVIDEFDLTHVQVPHKWLYLLPEGPPEEVEDAGTVVVVADRMRYHDQATTKRLWMRESTWTEEMIEELFVLLSRVPINDCGFINVRFSTDRSSVVFFDLEYPATNLKMVHRRLIHYLPPRWKAYWYGLLQTARSSGGVT